MNAGYKKTDVGPIPEDWDYLPLSELTRNDSPICYGIVQPERFEANGIPVLAIKNLNTDYITNVHRSSPNIEKQYVRSRVVPSDVFLSVKGTTGRVGIVPPHYCGNISRDLARLRLNDENMPAFLFQMLQSDAIQKSLEMAAVGTTRMELSIGIVKQIRVVRPPKKEQQVITEALSDVDALINALDALITKKRHIKQGTMQQLLTGKKRLPGFAESDDFENTEAGRLPTDWKIGSVRSFAAITTGAKNTQDKSDDGRFPFFVRSQIVERINSYAFDGEAVLTAGDGVGTGKVFHYVNGPFDFHQRVYKISDFEAQLNGYFFFLYFKEHFYERIMQMTAKSSVDSVRMEMIADMLIPLPSVEEQIAIATVLHDMDSEIAALEQKRDKTKLIKQGMMQELLTGKTRLI